MNTITISKCLFQKFRPVRKQVFLLKHVSNWNTTTFQLQRFESTKVNDKPIAYTKSKAFSYKASENFRVDFDQKELSYSPSTSIVLRISILIFLIYFCFLREPNDVDEMLDRDLFQIMPDLEIPMLESDIRKLEKHGVDTEQLKAKLEDIKKLKSQN